MILLIDNFDSFTFNLVQALGSLGAELKVVRAPVPVHGKTAAVSHSGQGVFQGMPQPFTAARYHSLVVERASLPDCLEVTAWHGALVMGLRHREHPLLEGVQFHPESFLTQEGKLLLANFLASGR